MDHREMMWRRGVRGAPISGWQIMLSGAISGADGGGLYVAEYFNQRLRNISLHQEPLKTEHVDDDQEPWMGSFLNTQRDMRFTRLFRRATKSLRFPA